MKIYQASLFICLFLIGIPKIQAQQPEAFPKNWLLSYHDLKGPVSGCKTFLNDQLISEQSFNKNGQMLELKEYLAGRIYRQAAYKYNSKNQLISNIEIVDKDTFQATYTYDKEGVLTSKQVARGAVKNKKGASSQIENRYSYDAQGRITGESDYYQGRISSTTSISYDEKGRVIRNTHFKCSSTGNCDMSLDNTYVYDEKGNLIEEKMEGFMRSKTTYVYNENNELIKKTTETELGETTSTNVVEYNPQNKTAISTNEGQKDKLVTSLEHDAKGNWIKKTDEETNEKGEKTSNVFTREITYF